MTDTDKVTIYLPPRRYRATGQRDKSLSFWSDEMLFRLKTLCQHYASWDDINAAFPDVGMSRVLIAMRHIIATECRGVAR